MDEGIILICTAKEGVEARLSSPLHDVGLATRHATSGEEGLALCRREAIVLALVDLELPDVKGASYLLELRKIRPSLEGIFLHPSPLEKHWRSLMQAGAFDLLAEGVDEKRLTRSVRGALSRHRVRVKKEELLEGLDARRQGLERELALRDEEIKNLRTGVGVEKAMEARIHLLEEERDRLRDTLVGKIRKGGDAGEAEPDSPEEIDAPAGASSDASVPDDNRLRIRYPARIYSILNFLFLAGAFLFAFAAVFTTGHLSAGTSERIRLALRSELLLVSLVWLEGGLLVKLHAVLSYFRLNPIADEFEEKLRLRERIYAFLGALLVTGALLAHGSALALAFRALGPSDPLSPATRITRFLDTASFHSYQLRMLTSAILPALNLLFLVLRLNLRYRQNLELHLQRRRTQNLLEKF